MKEENDKATAQWLQSQKKSTRYTYKSMWSHFLEFTGMTGDQILADKKQDKEYKWERKVMEFKAWLVQEKGFAGYTARAATGGVRGFFAYHRLKLEYIRSESKRLGEAKRKTQDYLFTRDELKKMCDFADLTEKYVVCVGKSLGMRAGDFLRITRGDVEPYLDREPPVAIGRYETEKESVPSYPFLDADALPVVKQMLETMDREGRTANDERILTYKHTTQLSRALQRTAKRAGIQTGNKVVRFHNLRKFLCDRLSNFMSDSKWKQIVGKKISEAAYVSPDSLREDYARATTETTFTKVAMEGDVAKIAKLEVLKQLMKSAGFNEEDLQALLTSKVGGTKGRRTMARRTRLPIDDQIAALEGALKQEEGECDDGVHCGEDDARLEQIPEAALLTYMKQGWKVEQRLSNGDAIVSR